MYVRIYIHPIDVLEYDVLGGGSMMRELTVKQYAAVEGVTPRTVWNWIDKGAVTVRRTPGGGLRVVIFENGKVMKSDENDRNPSM